MLQKLFVLLLLSFYSQVSAKVRILTFHYNLPEFIELQHKTFQKFMQDDYELIVFNDARDPKIEEGIRNTCEKYGIQCVRFEQVWHFTDPLNFQISEWINTATIHQRLSFGGSDIISLGDHPSLRHSHVIQFAMDHFGYNHDDPVVILDGDMFPVRPVSIKALLESCAIAGSLRYLNPHNIDYLWVPFIAFDIQSLPNKYDLKFHVGLIESEIHDTGADTYNYLKQNPQVKVKKYPIQFTCCARYSSDAQLMDRYGFNENEIKFMRGMPKKFIYQFHVERRFLHFSGSSFGEYPEKTKYMTDFIHALLEEQLPKSAG